MSRSIVKIKLDIIFKAIFGKKENEDLLHALRENGGHYWCYRA